MGRPSDVSCVIEASVEGKAFKFQEMFSEQVQEEKDVDDKSTSEGENLAFLTRLPICVACFRKKFLSFNVQRTML